MSIMVFLEAIHTPQDKPGLQMQLNNTVQGEEDTINLRRKAIIVTNPRV
jgi:hypothetical protein